MFIPAISTLLWVLVYSWPAEVVSNPLNVAPSPAKLQLPKGPQLANITSDPELFITQAVNATRSELFQIPGTRYLVELSSPAIETTIAVESLRYLLQGEINCFQAQIAGGQGAVVPYAIMLIGPTPDNLHFDWFNLDEQRRGSFAELIDILGFIMFISTSETITRPNPWFAQAFSYTVYWKPYWDSPNEKVGRGAVGLKTPAR